jgi:hypothetical protein
VSRRNWRKAPGQFAQSLTEPVPAALLAAGGLVIAVVGATLALPVALAAAGGSAIWAGFRSWPRKYKGPSDLLGEPLTLDDLNEVDPPVFKLGLVGPSRSGKTTLLRRIGQQPSPAQDERTQQIYARVFAVNQNPLGFLAVLDGSGFALHQQFTLIEHTDFLCIVLDHNKGDDGRTLEEHRLNGHVEFLDQLKTYMLENKHNILYINFLLNKRDLWQGQPEAKRLLAWFSQQADGWRTTFRNIEVTHFQFSNSMADDVVKLEERISVAYAAVRATNGDASRRELRAGDHS